MSSQQPTSLVERTRSLLKGAPRELTYTAIAKETGVSIAWISRFADGKIPNPGVNQVQAIFDYMTGRDA